MFSKKRKSIEFPETFLGRQCFPIHIIENLRMPNGGVLAVRQYRVYYTDLKSAWTHGSLLMKMPISESLHFRTDFGWSDSFTDALRKWSERV